MPVTTEHTVTLLRFGSAISNAFLKALFEKLDESNATSMFLNCNNF